MYIRECVCVCVCKGLETLKCSVGLKWTSFEVARSQASQTYELKRVTPSWRKDTAGQNKVRLISTIYNANLPYRRDTAIFLIKMYPYICWMYEIVLIMQTIFLYQIFINTVFHDHHHHHVALSARISQTLSQHTYLLPIDSGRFSRLYPVSAQSCCM